MSNRASTLLGALEDQLDELVASGDLKAVYRRLVDPLREAKRPCVGLVITRLQRRWPRSVWEATLLVQVVTEQGTAHADRTVLDLVAKVDTKLEELADSDGAGGTIDRPLWEPWYAAKASEPLAAVGALGTLRMTFALTLEI